MLAAPPAVETPHPAPVPAATGRIAIVARRLHQKSARSVFLCARVSSRIPSAPAAFWPDVFVKRPLPWEGFVRLRRLPPDRVRTAARPQPLCRLAAARRGATGVRTFRRDLLPTFGISSAGRYPQSVERSSAESRSGVFAPADYFRSAGSRQHSQTIVTPPKIKLNRDSLCPISWRGPT